MTKEIDLLVEKQKNKKLFNSVQSKLIRFVKDHNKTSFFSHVNYSPKDLIAHFEKCFLFYSPLSRMSWENYGEWEIDHFVPRSHDRFAKGSEEERVSKCFAKENLRPLPTWYNREKGSFYILENKFYSWNKLGPLTERGVYGSKVYKEKRKEKKYFTLSQIKWYETQYVKFLNNHIKTIRIKY